MYVPGIAIMKNLPEQRKLPVANENLAKCQQNLMIYLTNCQVVSYLPSTLHVAASISILF